MIIFKNPYNFLNEDRLDIICKFLYLKSIKDQIDDNVVRDLYIRHIEKRTAGKEPHDPNIPTQLKKENINDYLTSCSKLVNSFFKNGYDLNYPIYYTQGGIINGAHRIACSILFNYNIPTIYVNTDKKNKPWDSVWFEVNGFSANEISFLQDNYINLKNE
jgi:hypothetical protein